MEPPKRGRRDPNRRAYLRALYKPYGPVHPSEIPPRVVYNKLKAVAIDPAAKPTMETRRQADILFEKVQQASVFKSSKVEDKRRYLHNVLHALKSAMYHQGCVMHPRSFHHPGFSKARLQVIEALIEMELVHEQPSPKGSPKMSRLLPLLELKKYADADPWTFDPNVILQYVYLVDRTPEKNELPIDWSLHIAQDTQDRLKLINEVNSQYRIDYLCYDPVEDDFQERSVLRPVHYAKFTERWDWHGRLYTGQYGHQKLRNLERGTIQFNECPGVELDYSGMHPRLLYHLCEIDYRDDPYALWGKKTTDGMRLLAKKVISAAINAASRDSAISSCNKARSIYTEKKDATGRALRKSGKALHNAIQLNKAYVDAGIKFGEIYDLALRHHAPIAQYFSSDAGMWLMRIDSSIAMDVLYHFAKLCIPCLGVHDSFIVPESHGQELRETMLRYYRLRMGYFPVVK